jgi:hypothetical protein
VNAAAAPSFTATPSSATIIAGDQNTFVAAGTGVPTPSVRWSVKAPGATSFTPIAGATTLSYLVSNAALAQSGTQYEVTLTNPSGSVSSAATLTVVATAIAPFMTTQPPPTATFVSGQTGAVSAAAGGWPTPTVQWQVSTNGGTTWTNSNINGSGNAVYPTLSLGYLLSNENGYEFRAVFTNPSGQTVSAPTTLEIETAPTITSAVPPGNVNVPNGQATTLTAAAAGVPAPHVQWQYSSDGSTWFTDTTDAGSTTDSVTVTTDAAAFGWRYYRALFTNPLGMAVSNAELVSAETAPVITSQPPTQLYDSAGVTTYITAISGGWPTPTEQWEISTNGGSTWQNDTTDTVGASGWTLGINPTASATGNEYRAVMSNVMGTVTSAVTTLQVVPAGGCVTTEPLNTTVIQGASVTFTGNYTCASAEQWQVSTNGGSTWTTDSTDAGNLGTTLSVGATTPSENGNEYRVLFTTVFGTWASEAATLTVVTLPPIPTVTAVTPSAGIAGTPVTVTGTGFDPNPYVTTDSVSFGGTAAPVFGVSSTTSLSAGAPTGPTGTVDVTVSNYPGRTSATSTADEFTYVATPTLTGISPGDGPPAGGNTVTITGSGFAPNVTYQVWFPTVAGPVTGTYVSGSELTATAPAGSPGSSGSVAVSVNNQGRSTGLVSYTYDEPQPPATTPPSAPPSSPAPTPPPPTSPVSPPTTPPPDLTIDPGAGVGNGCAGTGACIASAPVFGPNSCHFPYLACHKDFTKQWTAKIVNAVYSSNEAAEVGKLALACAATGLADSETAGALGFACAAVVFVYSFEIIPDVNWIHKSGGCLSVQYAGDWSSTPIAGDIPTFVITGFDVDGGDGCVSN